MKHESFNAEFYTTVAAVIPIMFVAVAFEGGMTNIIGLIDQLLFRGRGVKRIEFRLIAALFPMIIIVLGIVAEGLAFLALLHYRNLGYDASFLMLAGVLLQLVVFGLAALYKLLGFLISLSDASSPADSKPDKTEDPEMALNNPPRASRVPEEKKPLAGKERPVSRRKRSPSCRVLWPLPILLPNRQTTADVSLNTSVSAKVRQLREDEEDRGNK